MKYLLKNEIDELTVLGHDNTDCDSCISLILMSMYLEFNKVKHKILIQDKVIDENTLNHMKNLGYDMNKYKGKVGENDAVFLLDHHETIHTSNVIGCIDHHPTIKENNYKIYINKQSASTAKLIYDIIESSDMLITKHMMNLVLFSMFSDTCSLKSTKCSESDKIWALEQIKIWKLNYENLYTSGLELTDTSRDINIIKENFRKDYVYFNKHVSSSYIHVSNWSDWGLMDEILRALYKYIKKHNIDLWVFLLVDLEKNKTIEYLITKNWTRENTYNKIMSRGSSIMPEIEKNISKIIMK